MIRIGIICPSEIAFRRFLPALEQSSDYEYMGVAVADAKEWFGDDFQNVDASRRDAVRNGEMEKAENFRKNFGGKIFSSYMDLISSDEIDAVYLPLPPALHFRWAKKALEYGKHIFVEKPSTIDRSNTEELLACAKEKELAVHENYMFVFHEQLSEIKKVVESGVLGDVRMYRLDFGFPRRAQGDFRYMKALGGGALLDCGGYTLKYASILLGEGATLDCAKANYTDEFDVDLYGSATMSNPKGETVQIAFGMDNAYKCDLEIWGSKGRLVTGRILTAPAGFEPSYKLITGMEQKECALPADDTFLKSLQYFAKCVESEEVRKEAYGNIQKQADLVDSFMDKAGMK